MKSSHETVAVCNDCHTPHDPIGKYSTKARNGFWHSYYFTLGGVHEPIQATPRSREIAVPPPSASVCGDRPGRARRRRCRHRPTRTDHTERKR